VDSLCQTQEIHPASRIDGGHQIQADLDIEIARFREPTRNWRCSGIYPSVRRCVPNSPANGCFRTGILRLLRRVG